MGGVIEVELMRLTVHTSCRKEELVIINTESFPAPPSQSGGTLLLSENNVTKN